jgi:hypothetical protein
MVCERYKKDLIEAAAGFRPARSKLQEHLQMCPECRTALAKEQALFEAIDTNLRLEANPEVPPNFVARAEAKIAPERVSTRRVIPVWAYALASAAVILAIGIGRSRVIEKSTQAPPTSEARIIGSAQSDQTAMTQASSRPMHLGAKTGIVKKASRHPEELEVLVQPGEEALLLRFYEVMQHRPSPAPPAGQQTESANTGLVIPNVEIARLEIKNLEGAEVSR